MTKECPIMPISPTNCGPTTLEMQKYDSSSIFNTVTSIKWLLFSSHFHSIKSFQDTELCTLLALRYGKWTEWPSCIRLCRSGTDLDYESSTWQSTTPACTSVKVKMSPVLSAVWQAAYRSAIQVNKIHWSPVFDFISFDSIGTNLMLLSVATSKYIKRLSKTTNQTKLAIIIIQLSVWMHS